MKEGNYQTKKLWQIVVSRWYVFLIGFFLCLLVAYLYLQKTSPIYEATASLLIKNPGSQPVEELVFSEFGMGNRNKNLENEVLVLSSTPLMYKVVKDLELQYQFIGINGLKSSDLYKDSPVKVLYWTPDKKEGELHAVLRKKDPDGYVLTIEEEEFSGEFGKELQLPTGKLALIRTGDTDIYEEIQIHISSIWNKSKELLKQFNVEVYGELSSVLSLSLRDINPYRAQEVLDHLIQDYNQKTIDDKNRVYENAIEFIDERLKLISKELSETESDVEEYKRRYNVVELSSEGNMILRELSDFSKEMSEAGTQMEILNTIQAFLLKNQKDFEFVPTNLSLNNLTLTRLLEKFNELLAERDLLRSEIGTSHPEMKLVESQLQNLRETIINNIYAIKKDLQIELKANRELQSGLESRLSSLPKRERELIDIERRKDIKENLYVYLLQKKEESAISLAVTAATGQLVEPPSFSTPVSPRKAQVWLIASFLGLAIPAGIVLMLESLNNNVKYKEDITGGTSVPIAGIIAQSKWKEKVVLRENVSNPFAELFRLLRFNISRTNGESYLKSLLITSSEKGEGKSYIALNLGLTQALTGRRVVIVDLDMRSTQPENYTLDSPGQFGLIDYLTNSFMNEEHIIQKCTEHPLLDIITSGARTADPGKMVFSNRLIELRDRLKERYDFIIFDAPGIYMAADTLEMKDLAEAVLFVVRSGVTKKSHLSMAEALWNSKNRSNMYIVFNGVSLNTIGFHGLTYGLGKETHIHRSHTQKNGRETRPELTL